MSRKSLLSTFNRVIYFSIKDPLPAKCLINHLVKSPDDKIIIPFADYPGPVIKEILSRQFKTLTICERNDEIRTNFQTYVKENFPDKNVKIFADDLFDLSFRSSVEEAQKRCTEIVKQTQGDSQNSDTRLNSDNTCDNQVKFLVPLMKCRHETSFFKNLYYQLALRIGLCSSTLINYYFLVSDRQYNYLDAKPAGNLSRYRSTTVLYNTIFKIHHLETFDLKSCFKINVRKIQGTSASTKSSYKKVHMIWLEPRLDVINNQDGQSLIEFRFLVSQLMHKRTSQVIASLEKWFDNCSYDLSKIGVTRSTRSGDLTIQQYYQLFEYVKNRQDYSRSIFRLAANQSDDNMITM